MPLTRRPTPSRAGRLAEAVIGAILLAGASAGDAQAAEWPERPVRVIVAFPPGASTDVLVRALAPRLTEALLQPVVVENRPGAGGNIATLAVVRSPPDGHTLLAHSVAIAVNPSLYRAAGYDPLRDLEPVAMLASTPNVITVNPRTAARDLPELVALARSRPLEYASSGTGTTTHLGMELLFRGLARVEVLHVSFGPAQAVTAVMAGQVPLGSTSLPPALPLLREGAVRAVAVTSLRRNAALPEVPTVAEQGFPSFEALTWFAVMAPARTPLAIADRLNAEVNRALATPEVRERLAGLAFDATPMSRPALADYVRAEVAKWAEVVRLSGATAD